MRAKRCTQPVDRRIIRKASLPGLEYKQKANAGYPLMDSGLMHCRPASVEVIADSAFSWSTIGTITFRRSVLPPFIATYDEASLAPMASRNLRRFSGHALLTCFQCPERLTECDSVSSQASTTRAQSLASVPASSRPRVLASSLPEPSYAEFARQTSNSQPVRHFGERASMRVRCTRTRDSPTRRRSAALEDTAITCATSPRFPTDTSSTAMDRILRQTYSRSISHNAIAASEASPSWPLRMAFCHMLDSKDGSARRRPTGAST